MKKSNKAVKSKKIGREVPRVNNQKKSRKDPEDVNVRRGTPVKENTVDDGHRKKSVIVFHSRCSPTCFKVAMEELRPILGQQQRIRIKDTPFSNWIDMPELAISGRRIDFILNRFDINSRSLTVGDDIMIPFTPNEFSIILGLPHIGQPMDLDLKMESMFVGRRFGGQGGKAKRATIYEKLISLACSDDELDIDDFVRLYILFIFNCIIFSTGNYYTPSFIFPYLDNLTKFFDYAWGDAAFRFLYREIRNIGSKSYLDGCTVGLMAWLYERVPSLGVRRSLEMFPRLFRWGDSKIPLKASKAESLLKSIESTKILSIYPFPEEKMLDVKLMQPLVLKPEDGTFDATRLEKLVRKQMDEIKNQMFVELKRGRKKKIVGDQEVIDFGAEVQLQSKNESGVVMEEDGHIEKNEFYENIDRNGEVNTEIIEDDTNTEKNEKDENTEKNEEDGCNLVQDNVYEIDKDVGNDDENDPCDDSDIDRDINVVVQNVVNEINNDVIGCENDYEIGGDRKRVSCVGTSNAENITSFQSSIVDTVRTRVDRKKKRKASMFVTPPSSTPRRKRKGKERKKSIVDVDEDCKSPLKDDLLEYKGRADYCGHDVASEEDQNVLTHYLLREDLNVVIWQDKSFMLEARKFCEFVFGQPIDFEIINVYGRIMQQKSKEYGSEIYCMDTVVQRELLTRLSEYGNNRKLRSDDYGAFIGSLTAATREKLQELNDELFTRCKYIIFPLNDRWHWFLLVYKTSEGVFRMWNSLRDPFATGTANIFVSFLAGCTRFQSGFVIGSEEVVIEECHNQGPTLECGVYACMWVESLARDTKEFWAYQRDVNMNAYRARVAATILSDANGLLKTLC